MIAVSTVRATLLATAIATGLAGCSDTQEEMSQEEIQYISHLDQSRFFQRQGELKASTLEARSAIELQPERIEPYLVIVTNLLTAGDSVNAERQLDRLLEEIGADNLNQSQQNEVALIRAQANLDQRELDDVYAALDTIQSPDRNQSVRAAIIRGDAELVAGNTDKAQQIFQQAAADYPGFPEPYLGLVRVALSQENNTAVDENLAKAAEAEPDGEDVWLWKARVAHSRGEWQAAEQSYINALESIGQYDVMTREKYETMSALIQVLREQGKSSEAFVYEEILAKSGPGTIKSNMTAAQDAYNDGDLTTAARYLEEILAQAPGHEQSSLMLGIIRYRQGRTAEAQTLLEPVAAIESNEQARKLLAATRLRLNDPEGAKALLDNLEDQQSDPQTLALVGIASLASGDTESGQQLVEKALELTPDNHQLRLRYAYWLNRDGQTEKAIQQARTVMKHSTDQDGPRALIIEAYQRSGNQKAAIESASAWVKEQPDNVLALLTRGDLAARNSDFQEAAQYFQQAEQKAPASPAPQVALGNLARAQENPEKAEEYFREAVMRDPDNRNALQGIATVMDREKLASFMARVQEQQPDTFGPRLILLENALIDNDTATADELTAALLEREEENAPSPVEPLVAAVYHGIGTQLVQRDRTDQAATVLERGRVLFPNNEAIALQAAAVAFRQDDTDNARDILREVKSNHPDSAEPYRLEAQYLEQQRDFRSAAELYGLAYGKQPTAALALSHAQALRESGQADTAVEMLEQAIQNWPGDERLKLALGMFYQQANNTEKALETYQSLVDQFPQNTVALNNLAWLYYQSGDDRAIELARRAHELSPQSGAVADTYGWILFESGQHAESLPVLEKAHELAPESEEIAMHLAEVYRAAGRNADARRVLEKFQNNG